LIGYARLRFPSDKVFRPEITENTSLIRELHVYGSEVAIGKVGDTTEFQHKGWGKKLLLEAERISIENQYKQQLVMSGIGAREYYKKWGYEKVGVYMGKKL